jgi:N-acetylmuramoyl-L-alanine amidase
MGSVWLGSLPYVIDQAGVEVDTYPGWETRSRSTGGYDTILGVQVHHTGSSGAYPLNEMRYMWETAADRPIGAIYLSPQGKATVGAAGATNTSGRGGPMLTSRGTIPLDSANRYVISIEAANLGNGTPWPDAQIEAYIKLVAALQKAYLGGVLLVPGDCHGHFEWTTRKIDPAGQSPYAMGGNKWNMTRFRTDVVATMSPPPPPPPTYERIAMATNFEFATAPRWDTRKHFKDPLDAGQYVVELAGAAGKVGATVNFTIVNPQGAGFGSVWPGGPLPEASKINFFGGQTVANEVSVALQNGQFWVYIDKPAHIIFDLVGYWT